MGKQIIKTSYDYNMKFRDFIKTEHFYDEETNEKTKEILYKDITEVIETPIVKGCKHGQEKVRRYDTIFHTCDYIEGVKHGIERDLDSKADVYDNPFNQTTYQDGVKHGECVVVDGPTTITMFYDNGVLNGVYIKDTFVYDEKISLYRKTFERITYNKGVVVKKEKIVEEKDIYNVIKKIENQDIYSQEGLLIESIFAKSSDTETYKEFWKYDNGFFIETVKKGSVTNYHEMPFFKYPFKYIKFSVISFLIKYSRGSFKECKECCGNGTIFNPLTPEKLIETCNVCNGIKIKGNNTLIDNIVEYLLKITNSKKYIDNSLCWSTDDKTFFKRIRFKKEKRKIDFARTRMNQENSQTPVEWYSPVAIEDFFIKE